jgi:hypothetical protein
MPQIMTHKVHLTRTNLAGKCAMTHNGQSLGVSKTPLFSAARKLSSSTLPSQRIGLRPTGTTFCPWLGRFGLLLSLQSMKSEVLGPRRSSSGSHLTPERFR